MSLPTCECVAGLPTQQQLANIYCALYTLTQNSGGGVTYPLSPTLGGTGVANAAGETITINGGAGIVLNQSLQTTDEVVFLNLSTGTVTCTQVDCSGTGVFNAISSGEYNGLIITANGGNTLNIATGITFTVSMFYTLAGVDPTIVDSTAAAPPTSQGIGTPPMVYGDPMSFLMAEPARWMTVQINGTDYRIPLYTA